MTDDLGRDIDAREDLEQEAQADGTVSGADGTASLVGQAETVISQPAAGETVTIAAAAGQQYLVEFDPEQAQVRVQGNNLILHFPDGGEVVFQGLGNLVDDPNPPVFEIADQPVSGAVIFTQAAALGEAPFITAAEPEVTGTGATQYSDDLGNLINLLNPQGVIPGTELAFHLIDLEPTEVLLGTNPPVDYDLDVTAQFFTSFADAGLTFAPGLGFGFGGGPAPTPAPPPAPTADLLLVAAAAPTNSFTEYDGSNANAFFGNSLLSPNPGGLQIQNVTYNGDNTAASNFSGVNFGSINGITFGLGSGFLLTSGDGTPALSNTSTGSSTNSGGGNDPDLIDLVGSANDSSVVEITFTVPVGTNAVSLDFMFGSEEFPEYINSFPDIAGVFVDGVNYAYFNGDPGQRLNINTASVGNFYATGSGQHPNQAGAGTLSIEYDGISRPLRLFAQLGEGTNNGGGTETHTLKIAVADTGDSALDSGLFVSNLQVANGSTGGIGDIPSEGSDGGGFLYEFQVGEKEIVTDNIHGTDVEDGVTTQFTITSLPHDSSGNPVGYLLIDRGDDNVIDQIVGPGFDSAPVDVETGDSVWYYLPKSDFAERPDVVTFNYFTTDSDGLDSLNDGPATVTIHLPDPVPTVTATDSMVDEDDLDGGEGQVSFVFQEPGSDTLDLGNPPFDPDGQQPTTVSGTITADFSFDEPGTIKFTQATIDALKGLGLTSSTVFGPSGEDHDAPLSYEISADGHTLTGFVDVVEGGDVPVFTVTLDPASSSGAFDYTFELIGSINHPDDAGENTSILPIKFAVQDLNGDTAVGTFNVTIVDDVPTIAVDGAEGGGASLKVWESDIQGGGGDDVQVLSLVLDGGEGSSAQATAKVVFGADGPEVDPVLGTDPNIVTPDPAVIAAIKLDLASIMALDESGTGAEGGDTTLSSPNGDGSLSSGLTSGGLEVFLEHPVYESGEFAGQPDPTRIVGYVKEPVVDGGEGPGFEQVAVFEASVVLQDFINHSPDQAYINFDLFRPLDHPDAGVDGAQTGDNDLFRLNLQVTVSDDDGDTSTLPVTVDVGDDGPKVFEAQTALVDEDGLPERTFVTTTGEDTGVLYATDGGEGGNLLQIDPETGEGTIIGPTGISSTPSLAMHPTTGVLYAGGGGGLPYLYTIDPDTGEATFVGDTGLGVAAIGALTFSADGTLYAAVNIVGAGGTGSDHLATIDLTTGAPTIIGAFGDATDVIIPSEGGGETTIDGIEALAFDASGTLWGALRTSGGGDGGGSQGDPGLYTIDVSTGEATFVAPILDSGGEPLSHGIVSLEFADDGTLYGGSARAQGEADDGGFLVKIDTTTGEFEFVGTMPATIGGAPIASLAGGTINVGGDTITLPAGIPGGPGDVAVPDVDGDGNETTWTGFLNVSFGADGPGDISFADLDGQPVVDASGQPVTSSGNPLVYRWDADTHTLSAVVEGQSTPGGGGGEEGFLVTWTQISADFQDSEVLGQIIDLNGLPVGPEITVNTTLTDRQDNSNAETLAGGRIVVAWEDDGAAGGPGISAQVFAPDGQPLGGEIAVNSSMPDSVSDPIVTALADGGFAVTWRDFESGSSTELVARTFDADGNPLSAEVQVSVPDGISALNHEVTALANGGFVVTWEDSSFSPDIVVDSLARVFDATGTAVTGVFPVSESTADLERMPDVTALSGGGFVVTWGSAPLGVSEFDVFARVFGVDGAPATGDILLTTDTDFAQDRPRVEALPNGGFAAVWQDNDDGSADVFARFFDASGAPQTGEITVNSTLPNFQGFSDIDALANGNVLVTWRGGGVGDDDGLFARIFQPDGTAVTGEFRINEDAAGSLIETETDFVPLSDGGFVATWTSLDGVVGRVFDADGNPVTGDFPVNSTTEGFTFAPSGAAPVSLGDGEPGAEHTVFELQITDVQNGEYVLTLLDHVDHAAPDEPGTADENDTFIDLPFTVTDFDGDSANGTLNVQINDDSPLPEDVTLTHDETPGVDNPDDVDPATKPAGLLAVLSTVFGGLVPDELGAAVQDITVNYGADGPGGISLDQVVDGTDSGLDDTATGRDILLFNGPDNTIVGRVAPAVPEVPEGEEGEGGEELLAQVEAPAGDVAFVIYMEEDGSGPDLWFVQYSAVLHDNPNDPDEANPEPVGTVTDENGRETTIPLFDDESLQITYTATDYDGDAVQGTATITIEDDGPTIIDGAEGAIHLVHDESAGEQTGGIPTPTEDNNDNDLAPVVVEPQVQAVESWVSLLQGTTVDLTAIGGVQDTLREGVNFDAGADGLGAVRLDTSALSTGTPTGLTATADGAPISYVTVDSGLVLGVAGYTGDDANGRPEFDRVVFSLHLDTTITDLGAGEAEFTFVQYEAVVHPLPGDGSGTPSTFDEGLADGQIDGRLNIGYVVEDKDGDSVTATGDARIVVDIEDDGPTLTGQTAMGVVEEEQLPARPVDLVDVDNAGNEDTTATPDLDDDTSDPANFNVTTLTATGSLSGLVSAGADQPASFKFTDTSDLPALTSRGETVQYEIFEDGRVLAAFVPGRSVFLVTLESDGSYEFRLDDQLDHHPAALADDVEGNLPIDLSAAIVASDGDGDTVALGEGTFIVKVIDDIPIASDDTNTVDADDTLTVVADDGVLSNDAFGADGPAAGGGVTGVVAGTGAPLDANVGDEIDGAFGTLTLNADGSYSYDADPGEGGTDVFTYEITDGDGDSTTATLTITVDGAEGAPTVENIFAIHDETPGVDLISDDTSNPLPSEISDQAAGLTLINASQKAIPFSFGSDGPGSIALNDVTDGELANFGGQILTDTETGLSIRLFNGDNDTVIGRVSAPDGSSDPAGAIAFISYIEQTGTPTGPVNEPAADLWTAQYRAIQHDNPLDPDEANPEQPGTLTETITFDGLATGTYDGTDGSVDGRFEVFGDRGSGPIPVSGTNPLLPDTNAAVVFDTAQPGSLSAGFGTPHQDFGGPGTGSGGAAGSAFVNNVPLGDVLIIGRQGTLVDGNGDGLIDTSLPQGFQEISMTYDFSEIDPQNGVTLESVTVLDVDAIGEQEGLPQGTVQLFGTDPTTPLATFDVNDAGFNGVETIDLGGTAGVLRMVITVDGSAGIDNIVFSRTVDPHDELIALDYTVTDANGDQAFGTGTVTFEDDGPMANSAAVYLAAHDPTIMGDVTANDSFGVDGPAADQTVISYSYTGDDGFGDPITITVPAGVSVPLTLAHGALTVDADGSYTYDGPFTVGDGMAGVIDDFSYVIQDGDGDTDTGTQSIRVYDPSASVQLGDDTSESLAGTSDSDFISGGGGGDQIDGQGGNDLLFGDAGDDTLTGGGGDDLMFGDDGADTFSFSLAANEGNDTIGDFSTAQGDVLSFTDVTDVNSDTTVDINDVVSSFGKTGDTVTVDLQSGTTVTFTDVDNSINDLNDLATHSLINGGAGV